MTHPLCYTRRYGGASLSCTAAQGVATLAVPHAAFRRVPGGLRGALPVPLRLPASDHPGGRVNKLLDCGDLEQGFARVRCDHCKHEYLLAFSCNGRWFCPSCHQKKVQLFGALLTETILYPVPHRHFTLGIPRMTTSLSLCRRAAPVSSLRSQSTQGPLPHRPPMPA